MDSPDQPMVHIDGEHVTDPPSPDLADLEQRDPPIPAVPVRHEGPVRVQKQPALRAAVAETPLDTTLRRVVDSDPRRSAVTLIGSEAWRMASRPSGAGALIPADIVLRLEHSDAIYARAVTGSATLTVIAEIYGD